MGKYARNRAPVGNRKKKPLKPGRKKKKKGAKKNAQKAPKLRRRRYLFGSRNTCLTEVNPDEKRELSGEWLVLQQEELRTDNNYWCLVRLVEDLHFDVKPLDPSEFPVHQVQHTLQRGLDLRCPPEILRRNAPLMVVGHCLCGLPREVCHRHRDDHYLEMWPIRQKIRTDQEVSLSETTKKELEVQELDEFLPLNKNGWPTEECLQLRNWLQDVMSKQWNRYEFPQSFKKLLLPALSKAISPRLSMVEDAAMLEEFLSQQFDSVFSKEEQKKLLPRILWALCWDFRADVRELQRQRQMDMRQQEWFDAIVAYCQKGGGFLTSSDVFRVFLKAGFAAAGRKRSQAWLAAGVYELVEFIQDRFKAVLPKKYLVRMDQIVHRRQLKERKRAPKEIEVDGEIISWNNPLFEMRQGKEKAKSDGNEADTKNLLKGEENEGTAEGLQGKRKTPENEEENEEAPEDSKQDEKKRKTRGTIKEEVEHGEEETASKEVQKAQGIEKGTDKDQGKSESGFHALHALQVSGREDESSRKDGKPEDEFKGKGNGVAKDQKDQKDQKEPLEKAEDVKDGQNEEQNRLSTNRAKKAVQKAAKRTARELAKKEAKAKKERERIETEFARAKAKSADQIARAKATNGDDVKVEPSPSVLQFQAAMEVPEPPGGAEKMKLS
eukprot:s1090_g17.t1